MSVGATKKALEGFLGRFKTNVENRGYLNTKPHAVIISREYLRAVGLSENAIEFIYSKTRNYVANVNKSNNGPAEFNEALGIVYFLSPGESSNFEKSARVRKFVSEAAKTVDNLDIQFETGHTLTANITESAYAKSQRLRNIAAKESVEKAYFSAVTKYRSNVLNAFSENYGLTIDVDNLRETVGAKTRSQFLVIITPQTKDFNQKVLNSLEREFKKDFTGEILATIKGSPSMMDLIEESLEDAFFGKRVRNITLSTRGRGAIKPKVSKSTETPFIRDKRETVEQLSLVQIQKLINLKLHDQIRKNMGKGESRDILNYRTGRFAKSVKAVGVRNTTKNTLDVNYTYIRYPYDTFLPGGRLYKPGRNPKTIIGKSIREIAREFVSNNFKVNPILK